MHDLLSLFFIAQYTGYLGQCLESVFDFAIERSKFERTFSIDGKTK